MVNVYYITLKNNENIFNSLKLINTKIFLCLLLSLYKYWVIFILRGVFSWFRVEFLIIKNFLSDLWK